MKQIGGNLFWECNTKPEEKCIKLIKNVFIGEILNAWCTITYDSPSSHFRHQILWNNSSIVIAQNTVYKKGTTPMVLLSVPNQVFFNSMPRVAITITMNIE